MVSPFAICFNPRPRVEGDWIANERQRLAQRFNPRPRVEGDEVHGGSLLLNSVSIRALAWRATQLNGRPIGDYVVSIRALAWRATRANGAVALARAVSIRALAWRATQRTGQSDNRDTFQSAPSRGGRHT